jgi:hypothetical protein
MNKEEIIKIIRDEVSKEFGAERIKDIEYFGPYEDEDLDVIVYVEGIDDRKDTVGVGMRISMFRFVYQGRRMEWVRRRRHDPPADGGYGSRSGTCGGGRGRGG